MCYITCMTYPSALQRFFGFVELAPNGCWLWHGHKRVGEYGGFWDDREFLAHRWAYEAFIGPVPEGDVLDHVCDTPACVNPRHVRPASQRENVLRGNAPPAWQLTRTHCKWGHPYDKENTLIHAGKRECKTCRNAKERDRYHRKRVNATN